MAGKNQRHTGARAKRPAPKSGTNLSALSPRKLLELYAAMLKCRMIRERGQRLRPSSLVFQEAIAVGATLDLQDEDLIVVSAQDSILGPCFDFISGAPMPVVLAGLRARDASQNGHLHHRQTGTTNKVIRAGPGTAQFSTATSVALASRIGKKSGVVVAFAGQDPAAADLRDQALDFAGHHKLPVVYVVSSKPAKRIAAKRKTLNHDLPLLSVDANDVVAVYRVAQEAMRRAREGHGPALIACISRGSRGASEAPDPLTHMENYLKRKDLWSDTWRRRVEDEFRRALDEAAPSFSGSLERLS